MNLTDSFASDSSEDTTLFIESKYITELSSVIDEKILKYIEERRRTEPTHSVEFQLELVVRYIESNVRVAHIFYTPAPLDFLERVKGIPQSPLLPNETDISVMMSVKRERFSTSRNDGWILSSDGNPVYLRSKIEGIICHYKIDVGHWLQSYLPRLGGGMRLLVEIPAEGELFDNLVSYIDNADNAFRRWDGKSVFVNCREIGTYLNKQVSESHGSKTFVAKERWGRAYSNFERFASLDLHIEDLSQSNNYNRKEVVVQKSDSEYLLTLTKVLINYAQELIGSK